MTAGSHNRSRPIAAAAPDRRVVTILRHAAEAVRVVRALREGVIGVVASTLDSPQALETIRGLRDDRGLVVLAAPSGRPTRRVAPPRPAPRLVSARRSFPRCSRRAAKPGCPAIPGAMTPTEVETAWRLGAAMVKLIPGGSNGSCSRPTESFSGTGRLHGPGTSVATGYNHGAT